MSAADLPQAPVHDFPTRREFRGGEPRPDSPPAERQVPFQNQEAGAPPMVSLRPIKAVAETFGPNHPLRTLLMGEPDDIPADEYALKVAGWFRLIRAHRP